MNLSFWMAVIYVMGRLGVWEPYLIFVQKILDILDRACEKEFGWDEDIDFQGGKMQ